MLITYLFLILIAALCVVFSKNIIQSVLNLIIVFFLCSLLFIYLGAEFIGLIILIVYIGAIAVLFLFVVMMLNIRILEIYSMASAYMPLILFLSFIFLCEIALICYKTFLFYEYDSLIIYTKWTYFINHKIAAIGQLLFNEFYILFLGATFLLFIAMIGVIVLVLNKEDKKHLSKHNLDKKYMIKNNIIWRYKNKSKKN